jgi:hypothetical protein
MGKRQQNDGDRPFSLTAKSINEASGAQLSISGVIVKRGTEIQIISTDPYTVVTGILKKVK